MPEQSRFTWKNAPSYIQSPVRKIPIKGLASYSFGKTTPIPFREFPLFSGVIVPLPASYYVRTLGYFCRQELKLEKLTSLPLRFRLGSLEYANRMEGKSNAWGPR